MLESAKDRLHGVFAQFMVRGSARSKTVKKNAYLSILVMISNNLVGFLFIPVVIGLIEPVRYGIWLTINSVLNWFKLMDLGLGGGLRTRLAQALARDDDKLARQYVSTAYAFLGLIVGIAILVFFLLHQHIDWVRVFNAPRGFAQELDSMMLVVVILFFSRFVLQLINAILAAFQMTFLSSLVSFVSHLSALIVIFFLFKWVNATLFLLGLIYTLTPLVVLFGVSVCFFFGKFKSYSPSLKYVKIECFRSIMSLGTFEFIDRIAYIMVASATNLIISHLGSPADVVPYSVSMRFMGLFLTVYTVATEPITPAITEAHTKKDMLWIKRVLRKANVVSISVVVLIAMSLPLMKPFIDFMLRGRVTVSFGILSLAAVLTSMQLISVVYGRFLTGIGVVRLVVLVTATAAALYYPLVYFFSQRLEFGVLSVLIAQIIVGIPIALIKYFQAKKILSGNARGLWVW